MVSTCFVFLLFGSALLLQVLPLGIHDFHVLAAIDKTTPGACQNAPLVTCHSWLIDQPRSAVLQINVLEKCVSKRCHYRMTLRVVVR